MTIRVERGFDVVEVGFTPIAEQEKDWLEFAAERRERVLDPGRDLGMDRARDDTRRLELAKLLRENPWDDPSNAAT